jgi:hypothetical protein
MPTTCGASKILDRAGKKQAQLAGSCSLQREPRQGQGRTGELSSTVPPSSVSLLAQKLGSTTDF